MWLKINQGKIYPLATITNYPFYRCHKVLEHKGLDLIRIVTERDNSIFDNILYAFVGIGAIQIGLTDVIKAMGVVPDYIIGEKCVLYA